jgi:hypothetical protein
MKRLLRSVLLAFFLVEAAGAFPSKWSGPPPKGWCLYGKKLVPCKWLDHRHHRRPRG